MRPRISSSRPQRCPPIARRVPRAGRLARPTARRVAPAAPAPSAASFQAASGPDPYLDYGRYLTPEGGVLFVYKDLDLRWRYTIWRVFAWTAATGYEGWYLRHHSPVQSVWINIGCFLAIAALNYLIVCKPIEVYRRAEIRPDCMILEGADIFWLRRMETGWPAFRPDKDGNQVLSGVYGTRFVAYLTARRFDDNDRMPDVFAAHLMEAMMQLWAPLLKGNTARAGSHPRQRF